MVTYLRRLLRALSTELVAELLPSIFLNILRVLSLNQEMLSAGQVLEQRK